MRAQSRRQKLRRFCSAVCPYPPALDSAFILLTSSLVIIVLCCLLPVAWVILQIWLNRHEITGVGVDGFRAALLGRTILYNGAVGVVAVLLGLPAAWVLGRGRGWPAAVVGLVLPISLLMPSLVIAYGWKQLVRLLGFDFPPAGLPDVARCVWSLATWLWPVPAMLVGLALRRSDAQVQQQALLDGVLKRVMFRQVLGPIVASGCIVSLLAMQEFAVYEPTGVSVVATEVRMVFETGAFSSPDNPITQIMAARPPAEGSASQQQRAAAAVATALPMLVVIAILALVAMLSARTLSAAEQVNAPDFPRSLEAPVAATLLSWLIVARTLGVPLVALTMSLKRPFDVMRWWGEFSPQIVGTLVVAGITGMVAAAVGFGSVFRPGRGLLAIALIAFLLGGQILAIALIRLYNRPALGWVYDGVAIMVMAYVGRFGWIALWAAAMTWSRPWRGLRDLAAVDGATAAQTARHVIWPLAWPTLGAAAMFVLILSLSEVPATVLISPQRPQMLVPMLMTWVHMLRYDPMIEASLAMAGIVVVLGAIGVVLGWIGSRWSRIVPTTLAAVMVLSGCGDRASPQAIWCSTGVGPAQVIYPRAITYSPLDDTFFIVDRQARIQHLDRRGQCIGEWRTPQWTQGKPVGLSVGPDANLYVPDTHYHRVLVYSADGRLVRQWGQQGTGPGQFIYPTDVAFDSKARIFVSEYGDNDRVQVFDETGNYLYEFGSFGDGPGQLSRPQSMVIRDDLVYITDSCNHRLSVFKTDGTFVRTMGKVGSGPGEFRFPYGLDLDNTGRLVVCEFGNNRVQLIDRQTGRGLAMWGVAGREPGELA